MINMFSVALLLLLAAGSSVRCEQLTQPDSVTVQPGQSLTISCQVTYAMSTYRTHWIRQPAGKGLMWIGGKYTGDSAAYMSDSLKNKFNVILDSSRSTLTLNGQNMQPEDTAVYYCAREYNGAFDYWGKGTAVTVTSATSKGPDVFPLMPCGTGSGDTVTLGCLATGFTPSSLTFSWNQDGSSLTDFIQYPPIQKGSEYMGISQIRVKRQDWEARKPFQCAVNHASGSGQAPFVKPNMHYQLPDLKLCSSSVEGTHEASFSCFAKDFSPNKFEFKWLKDGRKINSTVEEIVTQSGQRKFTNGTILYSAASLLTVKTSELITGAKFTCQFNGKGENNTESEVTNDVTYKECSTGGDGCPNSDVEVKIIEPTSQDMLIKKKGSLICQATVSRGKLERIVWEDVHGKELVSINTTTSKVFKAVLDISYEEWVKGIERICIVHNDAWFEPLKKPYKRQNGEPLRPSVFMLPPLEHTKKDMVVLTCYVKDFYPHDVFVSWSVDDEEAGSSFRPNTTAPIENDGLYSVYSQITLSLEQWQQPDQVYSCAVYHQAIVNSNKAIVRSIGYRTFANTNMVNLNLNVPETCKAE